MIITLNIWRQSNKSTKGQFEKFELEGVSPEISLLELLDDLNIRLVRTGKDPIVFDHDCREGICGQCGFVINGEAHGPLNNTSTCQIHMRSFKDGDVLYLEPFRSSAFPIRRDLSVDRSSLDRIIMSGGYISVNTGQAPEANSIPISKANYEKAMDAAACIGCGACVAACPNGSAALFTSGKIAHFLHIPQGTIEHEKRTVDMVLQMDKEGFGACSNHATCEAVCPAGLTIEQIAVMNKSFLKISIG